ncbi:MAG: succinate dehydrogenase [Paracoccaceae bacterium]|nr:succinate dehydrogenase [Paracoccaceae bacterium]
MLDLRLYVLQRISALVMVPFVLVHLGVIIVSAQGGLSATEILSRTQGSAMWFLFYSGFVVAVSIHAAIGVRVIAHEWSGLRGGALLLLTWATGACLLGLGGWAVLAVTLGPS